MKASVNSCAILSATIPRYWWPARASRKEAGRGPHRPGFRDPRYLLPDLIDLHIEPLQIGSILTQRHASMLLSTSSMLTLAVRAPMILESRLRLALDLEHPLGRHEFAHGRISRVPGPLASCQRLFEIFYLGLGTFSIVSSSRILSVNSMYAAVISLARTGIGRFDRYLKDSFVPDIHMCLSAELPLASPRSYPCRTSS